MQEFGSNSSWLLKSKIVHLEEGEILIAHWE